MKIVKFVVTDEIAAIARQAGMPGSAGDPARWPDLDEARRDVWRNIARAVLSEATSDFQAALIGHAQIKPTGCVQPVGEEGL